MSYKKGDKIKINKPGDFFNNRVGIVEEVVGKGQDTDHEGFSNLHAQYHITSLDDTQTFGYWTEDCLVPAKRDDIASANAQAAYGRGGIG